MKGYILVLGLYFFPLSLTAQSYESCISYYKQAEYDQVKEIFEKNSHLGAFLHDSTDLLDAVSTSYINLGEYDKAKSLLVGSPLYKSAPTIPTADYALLLNNLGLVYDGKLDFDSALYCLNKALKIRNSLLGNASLITAESYYNLGSLMLRQGDYDKAEELLVKTLSIESKNYDRDDPSLALTLNNLAVVNEECGRYVKALSYYELASSIFSKNPGRESYQYGLLQFNKGKVFMKLNQIDTANLYLNSANLILKQSNVFVPEIALLEIDLIDRLIMSSQLDEAEVRTDQFEKKWNLNEESWRFILSDVLFLKAKLQLHKGQPERAMSLVKEAKKEFSATYKSSHINIIRLLDFEANLFIIQKAYEKSQLNFMELHALILTKIRTMFPSFSEKEREQFFFKVRSYFEKYATLLITNPRQKGIASQLYNNQLATKAILLNYTNRWKRQILMSGDVELIKQFSHWQEMKSQFRDESEKVSAKNSISLDSLEEEVNALEKRLSARSEYFARHIDYSDSDWKLIRSRLKKNEAAIEIIRFRKFDYGKLHDFTNEIYYAALVITQKTVDDPEVVIFKNGNELENRILKQYRNSILLKQEDTDSYNQFWKPIRAKLKGVERVYFSPDGIFNLINFNTLKNPETGQYLLEEIHWRQVTNTKDLLMSIEKEEHNKYALLFGGPDFQSRATWTHETMRSFVPSFRTYQTIKLERGKGLAFLPGAKMEVENIRELLEKYEWDVDLFEGKNALEENLKHSLKPKLLHIATHGYFQADNTDNGNQRGAENLLLRSGLMLAGAETSLDQPEGITDMGDQEDGILTAYEAVNLNLENTELVVLSACETGLGEIQNGEGVYGLQRAFRVAGAKNLIMSLWKVDDEVTRYLMELFYKEWLSTGDKYGALLHAQKIVKEKFPDPYYWGAFVLVGN